MLGDRRKQQSPLIYSVTCSRAQKRHGCSSQPIQQRTRNLLFQSKLWPPATISDLSSAFRHGPPNSDATEATVTIPAKDWKDQNAITMSAVAHQTQQA